MLLMKKMIYVESASELFCVFFFQAEDGIRDVAVTGVQTCALPIYGRAAGAAARPRGADPHAQASDDETRLRRVRHRDRKSGGEGKRGDLGGRRIIKKKKTNQNSV